MSPDEAIECADERRLSGLVGGCIAAVAMLTEVATEKLPGQLNEHLKLLYMEAYALHLDADADELANALVKGFDTSEARSRVLLALQSLRLKPDLELFMRRKETRQRGGAKGNAKKQKLAAALRTKILDEADRQRRVNGRGCVKAKAFAAKVAMACDCSPRKVEIVLSSAKR